ncbi:MAG: hypothetical protein ABMB14_06805 [Myxococcota bacterium]
MSRLPVREAARRTAEQRASRAAELRRVLGPVEAWPEDWRVELGERMGLADCAEVEVLDEFRSALLRRVP